jgi:hypothetical protein
MFSCPSAPTQGLVKSAAINHAPQTRIILIAAAVTFRITPIHAQKYAPQSAHARTAHAVPYSLKCPGHAQPASRKTLAHAQDQRVLHASLHPQPPHAGRRAAAVTTIISRIQAKIAITGAIMTAQNTASATDHAAAVPAIFFQACQNPGLHAAHASR